MVDSNRNTSHSDITNTFPSVPGPSGTPTHLHQQCEDAAEAVRGAQVVFVVPGVHQRAGRLLHRRQLLAPRQDGRHCLKTATGCHQRTTLTESDAEL